MVLEWHGVRKLERSNNVVLFRVDKVTEDREAIYVGFILYKEARNYNNNCCLM